MPVSLALLVLDSGRLDRLSSIFLASPKHPITNFLNSFIWSSLLKAKKSELLSYSSRERWKTNLSCSVSNRQLLLTTQNLDVGFAIDSTNLRPHFDPLIHLAIKSQQIAGDFIGQTHTYLGFMLHQMRQEMGESLREKVLVLPPSPPVQAEEEVVCGRCHRKSSDGRNRVCVERRPIDTIDARVALALFFPKRVAVPW